MSDPVVESVISRFRQRSDRGQSKYGKTLDRTDLSNVEWLAHAQEEAMDLTLYLERLRAELARLTSERNLWREEALAAEQTARKEQMTLYGAWMTARQARIDAGLE